jgi:hypothetical protein
MRPDGRISVYPPGGSAVKEQSGPRKSAVGQVLEIGNQLPGRRGPRRVDGAHIGPTHAPGRGPEPVGDRAETGPAGTD